MKTSKQRNYWRPKDTLVMLKGSMHSLLSLSLYLPRSCILPRFLPSSFERIKIASLHHLLAEREEAQTHSVHRYQQDDTSPSFVIKKA